MKHTPEHWDLITDTPDNQWCSIVAIDKDTDRNVVIITDELDHNDARRIVACVNACAGMEDPAKEIAALRAKIAELKEQIDVLAENASGVDGIF